MSGSSPQLPAQAEDDERHSDTEHDARKKASVDDLIIIFGFLLVFVSGIAFGDYPKEIGAALKGIEPVLTAIATGFIALFTIKLSGIGKQQADILGNQAAMAAAAQRAFVSVQFKSPVETPGIVRLATEWHNSGETPTRRLVTSLSYEWFATEMPDDFKFADDPKSEYVLTMIAPKGNLSHLIELPQHLLAHLLANRGRSYFWGWAEYDDIFSPATPRHRTEFCSLIVADQMANGTHLIRAVTHKRHNGADDECIHKPRPFAERLAPKKP